MWHRIRVYLSFTLINACLSQAESQAESKVRGLAGAGGKKKKKDGGNIGQILVMG